jgi:putative flippase GtrA
MGVLSLDYRVANAWGYAVGCVVSFLLNRSWTFRHDGSWHVGAIRWFSVVVAAYLCNFGTIVFLHSMLGLNAYIAQLGGIMVYTGASFIGGRYFAFRNKT